MLVQMAHLDLSMLKLLGSCHVGTMWQAMYLHVGSELWQWANDGLTLQGGRPAHTVYTGSLQKLERNFYASNGHHVAAKTSNRKLWEKHLLQRLAIHAIHHANESCNVISF